MGVDNAMAKNGERDGWLEPPCQIYEQKMPHFVSNFEIIKEVYV